jgi:hypothetical protein
MAYPQLSLNQWDGIIPVILPVGPQTVSCIGVASAGVAVPFFFFVVALFYLLIPVWLNNFHADALLHQNIPRGLECGAPNNYLASGRMPLDPTGCMDGYDGCGGQKVAVSGYIHGGRMCAGGPMMMMPCQSGSSLYLQGGPL